MKNERLVAAGLGLTLLSSGACEAADKDADHSYICEANVLDAKGGSLRVIADTIGGMVCDAATRVNKYWNGHGEPAAAAVPIIYLHNSEYKCRSFGQQEEVRDRPGNNQYCTDSNSIVLSHSGLTRVLNEGDTAAMQRATVYFTVSHEKGHAVQDKEKGITALPGPYVLRHREIQADCLAGQAEQGLTELADDTLRLLGNGLPVRGTAHGSPQQRHDAFALGQAGGDCSLQSLVTKEIAE